MDTRSDVTVKIHISEYTINSLTNRQNDNHGHKKAKCYNGRDAPGPYIPNRWIHSSRWRLMP